MYLIVSIALHTERKFYYNVCFSVSQQLLYTFLFDTKMVVCPLFQGQCFVAIDPSAFAPGFTDRLQSLNDHLRHMEPVSS